MHRKSRHEEVKHFQTLEIPEHISIINMKHTVNYITKIWYARVLQAKYAVEFWKKMVFRILVNIDFIISIFKIKL
jgi:hypothetical protein